MFIRHHPIPGCQPADCPRVILLPVKAGNSFLPQISDRAKCGMCNPDSAPAACYGNPEKWYMTFCKYARLQFFQCL